MVRSGMEMMRVKLVEKGVVDGSDDS